MKVSNKQKRALEKISGRAWDTFSLKAVEHFFAFTDRGVRMSCDDSDFCLLLEYHRQHAITVEFWKRDFKIGLLFLWDFLQPEYPQSYIKRAFGIYESTMGYIPTCYREHPLSPIVYAA